MKERRGDIEMQNLLEPARAGDRGRRRIGSGRRKQNGKEAADDNNAKPNWAWNLTLLVMYLVSFATYFVLALVLNDLKKYKAPITIQSIKENTTLNRIVNVGLNEIAEWPQMLLLSLAFGFLFIAQLIVVFTWSNYAKEVNKGCNIYRWVVHPFVSSWLIALGPMQLSGQTDIHTTIALFVVNFLFGLECYGDTVRRHGWQFVIGVLGTGAVWYKAISTLFLVDNDASVPAFVWVLIPTYLVMFYLFPINEALIARQWSLWKDPRYGEVWHQVLEFVSTTFVVLTMLLGIVIGDPARRDTIDID